MSGVTAEATPERLTAVLRRAGVIMSAVHDLGCLELLD